MQKILKEVFGYTSFRGQQQSIIETIHAGGDALVLMPTGGGKSLCYQIPALLREGCGVVISPLIALMQDQVDALKQLGVAAECMNSAQSGAENSRVRALMQAGELDLLYLSPERLLRSDMRAFLQQCKLALFAIDEAHCVSQWGHDFRKEYQQLGVLAESFPGVPRVALTATADARVREEIMAQLRLDSARVFVTSFDRPNIKYAIEEQNNAKQQLWRFIDGQHANDAGIVYCLSRRKVEAVTEFLNSKGRTALAYHAGLSAAVRTDNQQRFLMEEGVIMVATIAFGMGIDKPNVRFVAHFSLPKNIESYYQETGRAGRDGLAANAWMIYNYQDVVMQRQFITDSDAAEQHKSVLNGKLDSLVDLCEQVECRRQTLLAYFNETLEKPCGHCDNCTHPPKKIDVTEAAQMALSAVYRTGQRYGMMYLIDVLTGKDEARIQQQGHDKLALFGLGQAHSKAWWRRVFRQLISQAHLLQSDDTYKTLCLSEKCRSLLKGTDRFFMRELQKQAKTAGTAAQPDLTQPDLQLLQALKQLRTDLATEQGVPPYVIFSDASLLEMVRKRPANEEKFMYISGVGEYKLKKYGAQFLQVIASHQLPELLDNRLSNQVNQTLDLLRQGSNPEQIAAQRDLPINTVYSHLSEAIAIGLVEKQQVLDLKPGEIEYIIQTAEMTGYLDEGKMKPVYEALDGLYDYGVLKCVLAEISAG